MIQFEISNHGAELQSLQSEGKEYLWQGNPEFWGRKAPILFPIVGRLANDTLRIEGIEYKMSQHGFARDTEFAPTAMKTKLLGGIIAPLPHEENALRYIMSQEPRVNYPYLLDLVANYTAQGNILFCEWQLTNRDNKIMHFQIGAHPAFNLPDYNSEEEFHGYLQCFDANGRSVFPVVSHYLVDGLRHNYDRDRIIANREGIIPITESMFQNDAILIENSQVTTVVLLDKHKNKVLSVVCPQAEAFGLWAPNKPGCPFVCIEPWCGIADMYNFNRDISEREYNHVLNPGRTYLFSYTIQIH